MRNYHAEKRFELHYYTCAGCYLAMTVDNRSQDDPNAGGSGVGVGGGSNLVASGDGLMGRDDIVASPLERLIHTKWAEAKVTFKGPPPASLSY